MPCPVYCFLLPFMFSVWVRFFVVCVFICFWIRFVWTSHWKGSMLAICKSYTYLFIHTCTCTCTHISAYSYTARYIINISTFGLKFHFRTVEGENITIKQLEQTISNKIYFFLFHCIVNQCFDPFILHLFVKHASAEYMLKSGRMQFK